MNSLRTFISESFLKIFYRRRNKSINILAVFLIFYKNSIKTFLKWFILTIVLKTLGTATLNIYLDENQ